MRKKYDKTDRHSIFSRKHRSNKKVISAVTIAALVLQTALPSLVFADMNEGSMGTAILEGAVKMISFDSETDGDSSADDNADNAANFADAANANDSEDTAGAYELDEYAGNEVLVMYTDGSIDLKQYASQEALAEGLAELDEDSEVELYQPNLSYESETVTTETPDDRYYSDQWALENDGSFKGYRTELTAVSGVDTNVSEAWENYTAKRNVVIALIDTGVDYTNSELTDAMWVNEDEISGNGIDDDGNGYVDDVYGWNFYDNNNTVYTGTDDNHGTHGAGTIAAASNNTTGIAGIADYDNIKIMPLKALGGSDGAGTTLSVIMAIKYAEANGAQICNLSLGTDTSDLLLYKVMQSSDMLFVVAAGNSTNASSGGANTDVNPSYPASYNLDNIISVANISADGSLHKSSDYGVTTVDLAAPGTDILSTIAAGRYGYMTGTSMAAPMVTAAAAMVYSGSGSITLADTKDIILSTTAPLSSLSGKVATGGMLDIGAAVTYDTSTIASRDWASSGSQNVTVIQNPSSGTSGQPQNGGSQGGDSQNGGSGYVNLPVYNLPDRNFDSPQFTYISYPSKGGSSRWQFSFEISLPSFLDRWFSF